LKVYSCVRAVSDISLKKTTAATTTTTQKYQRKNSLKVNENSVTCSF